jgi:hypothetical protein
MNEEKKKKGKDFSDLGDDSGEMDVIKDVFSSAGPEDSSSDIFSTALFDAQKQEEPEPAKEEEKPAPVEDDKGEPTEEEKPAEESSVHVVTDQDLKSMFDEGEGEEVPGKPEHEGALPFEKAPDDAPEEESAAEDEADEGPVPEKDLEEVIDHIEEEAQSGEIKPVEAGMKETAIDRIKKQIESLETLSGDFMSTKELKKLFQNFNIMIALIQEVMHQLEVVEKKMIEKGLLDPEDLDKW